MPRGKKECSKCGHMTGPRAHACPNCGNAFSFKAQSKEKRTTKIVKNINWQELQNGDKIKVNGGPYYISGADIISMGYRGKFIVDSIDENGIRAFGIDKNSGFCHIYMGEDIENKETGIFKTKHRVIKLQQKKEKDESLRLSL